MLYLAEVQKQKGGLLGSAKTQLKLLACQRTDQSWSTVSEEVIAAEEAGKLSDGVLVLVEMNPNRHVQRIQEAGRPLVNILQNFSRQLEKFKVKEEEIDQWKQSLTFQVQELNRREMDMEARLEELQQMEAEQQELETSREEIEKLQTEIGRNRQELEGAWDHLRGEQRRFEEYKAEYQHSAVLDEEQSRALNELLAQLLKSVAPTETVREHLNFAFEMLESQQAILNPHWQQLQQQKTAVNQQQEEVDHLSQDLSERQREWQQTQKSLEQQIAELNVNTATVERKQEYARVLKEQLRHQEELHQKIHLFAATIVDVIPTRKFDVAALEKMPLEQLQDMVQDLQQKLNIDSSFVHEQEQELKEKQKNIEKLQQKINQASQPESGFLEAELADENDFYQMLNETLVGQRRNLLERQYIFKQYQIVLLRRQGKTLVNEQEETNIDLKSILLKIEMQQQQSQELENLEREIEQLHPRIKQMQEVIAEQTQQQETQRHSIQTLEQNLFLLQTVMAESRGRLNLYHEVLQPLQDSFDGMRQKLQGIAESLASMQETGEYQLQAVTQIRQTLLSLISQPQLPTS